MLDGEGETTEKNLLAESHQRLIDALEDMQDEFNLMGVCEAGACRHVMCSRKWRALQRAGQALGIAKEILKR